MGPLEEAERAEIDRMKVKAQKIKDDQALKQQGPRDKHEQQIGLEEKVRLGEATIGGNIIGDDIMHHDALQEKATGTEVQDWLEEAALAANTKNSENLQIEMKFALENEARARKEQKMSQQERIALEHDELAKANRNQ